MEEQQNTEVEIKGFPAAIRATQGAADQSSLLELAKARAFDPDVFNGSPPFFMSAEVSNNRIDAYFSRMMPSSLKNYAADATAGVSFQDSHNHYQLGLGYSLTGRFVGAQGDGLAHTMVDFFTIPDLQLPSMNTNDLIRGVRAGIFKDVSIGFYGGRSVCSICGGDMSAWGWLFGDDDACPHYPGEMYLNPSTGQMEMAIEEIEDAHLAEVSQVYDGACPGAAIMKAIRAVEAGRMTAEQASRLEQRYRMKLPGIRKTFAVSKEERMKNERDRSAADDTTANPTEPPAEGAATAPPATDTTTADPPTELANDAAAAADEVVEEVVIEEPAIEAADEAVTAEDAVETEEEGKTEEERGTTEEPKIAKVGLLSVKYTDGRIRNAGALSAATANEINARLRALEVDNARLSKLADDGTAYRTSLIEEALAEGVRAQGKEFPMEQTRKMLDAAPLETIRSLTASYKAIADKALAGGRSTTDEVTGAPGDGAAKTVKYEPPAAAFMS